MENFELIDNLFQITVLLCACVAAGILSIRHRNRSLLILSLAYACFAMGTIYYVLYLVIIVFPNTYSRKFLLSAFALTACMALLAFVP